MFPHMTCVVITCVILVLGLVCAISGIHYANKCDETHKKIYDEHGNCQECGYPSRWTRDMPRTFSDGAPRHHANCPLGRLGL